MAQEGAQVLVGVLNKVMRYAVGLGVTASVLQTSLYTGACERWHGASGATNCR